MPQGDFQRARSQEAKQQRAREILDAARELGREHGVGRVSLTDIALAVDMHKSALLRYFETREQIFLVLAAEDWREWAQDAVSRLERLANPAPRSVGKLLAVSLGERPFFCDLVSHAALSLERHVSIDTIRTFKQAALESTHAVAEQLQKRLGLTLQQAVDVVATAAYLAGSFWQVATPAPQVRDMYRADPRLRHVVADISPRLSRILEGLLAGWTAKVAAGHSG